MSIDNAVRERINQLLSQSSGLSAGNQHGLSKSDQQRQACSAWLVSAQNMIHRMCESPTEPYRTKADRLVTSEHGYAINKAVGEMASILRLLLIDADAGLLSSVADKVRAKTFDDFLDHAEWYLQKQQKNESGVIAGVVFEDTLRQICRKLGIEEAGEKLDNLISKLAGEDNLTGIQAKRARVAAGVRTHATHAQWDELNLGDVRETIAFTRELLVNKLDG